MSNKINLKRYFGEILREFFDYGTPNHYRVNLSNPRTLLHEILNYCELLEGTDHLQHEHIKHMINEYFYLMDKDPIYAYYKDIFSDFHEFLKQLRDKSGDKSFDFNKNIYLLITRLKSLVVEVDARYYPKCCKDLEDILDKDDDKIEPKDFVKIKKIVLSFATEILRRGYSKGYIYDKIMNYLILDYQFTDFINSFNQDTQNYNVYLKLLGIKNDDIVNILKDTFGVENVSDKCFTELDNIEEKIAGANSEKGKTLVKSFKELNNGVYFIKFSSNTIDYGDAVKLCKKEFDNLLDRIYYEFSGTAIYVFHHGICTDNSNNVRIPTVQPQIDGYRIRGSINYFRESNKKIIEIYNSKLIDTETKNKLKTLMRFYRYFVDADTLEHKFLNLWIGWEHVFSLNITRDSQTWRNIHTFFPYIHAINYPKSLLKDMLNVQMKRNLKISQDKKGFNEYLKSLISDDVRYQLPNLCTIIKEGGEKWEELLAMKYIENDDLTKVKLYRIKQKLSDPKKFIIHLKEKTEWDLFRMYRIRNAIIHKGNIDYLGLPLEAFVTQLESFYSELLEEIIDRLIATNRFNGVEQLFLAYKRTYDCLSTENGLKEIKTPKDMQTRLINRPLIY